MPENISIRCEGNLIKVNWEWGSQDFFSMKIFYKKKEVERGDGSEFKKGGVLYQPGKQNGSAEKVLTNENGLYTFTLLPVRQNEEEGERVIVPNVMLGSPQKIKWRITLQRNKVQIVFPRLQCSIPSGVACVEYDSYIAPLNYEIDRHSRLVFPFGNDAEYIALKAKEPYDKVYQFVRI